MEKVNLIPAAELPVAETHDVEVICLEEGELKRKPAADIIPFDQLPATEAEEVEVICLEEGELKRKPAANLGGGYDATVTFTYGDDGPIPELTSGSYDAIRAKVLAGDAPNIKVVFLDGNWRVVSSVTLIEACEDTEEDNCVWLTIPVNGLYAGIRPDNTMLLD